MEYMFEFKATIDEFVLVKITAHQNNSYHFICVNISEVGGSEFAFRQASRNREVVSFRVCVHHVVSGCEKGSQ
jgi:hypothetical protein